MFLTFILTVTVFNLVKCKSDQCYQSNENPYSFLASKTVYNLVSAKQNYTQPNCIALQIWLLSRHGTRHPDDAVINKISKLVEYKNKITENSTLCQKDFEAIKSWNFSLTKDDNCKLNSQGVNDMTSLGIRIRKQYENIFNKTFSAETFRVLSSPKSRCVNSALYFLKSAFNMDFTESEIPLIDNNDIRLNISKFKTINDEDDSMKTIKNVEVEKFKNSFYMQQLILRVTKVLGLDRNLTLSTVKVMYEACRFERAWHVNSHPAWCAVFSQEDLEILEYAEDLKYYYENGYGKSFNERIGCPMVKDLFTTFRSRNQRGGPTGVFYFGHSSNVFSTIVRLGFAKDNSSLLGTNFKEMHNRKWKTSYLSPFASNVMAVLYECDGVTKVTFFVNEIPMVIEKYNCTLCPWDLINEIFDPIVSSPSCTFDQMSSALILSESIVILFIVCSLNVLNKFYFNLCVQ